MAKFSEADFDFIRAATHSGMSTEAFQELVKQWLATAKDPRVSSTLYGTGLQPMIELMEFLRANGFRTYIVTGGGQEFVRVYSQRVYDIPPEQVVGSSILTKYEYPGGKPELMREPKVFFVDDREGKPAGINLFIGKRPYAAFGNSNGDQQMLEWASRRRRATNDGSADYGKREYAYGPAAGLPDSPVGTFSDSLMAEARKNGGVVVSMKNDGKRVFNFEKTR